jgi:trk system potassium uptake protein TrkA
MKIAIAGAGKLGIKMTEMLLSGDHTVTVIDKDEEVLHRIGSNYDIMTISGNAKQISLLKDIDINTYDYLLACTDEDEKNIIIASFAKKLGCRHVIARLRDPEHMAQQEFIKEKMDIDDIINPDYAITHEIYIYLVEKYTISNGVFSTGKIALLECISDKLPEAINHPVIDIKSKLGDILVVAVSRNGKVIIPRGDHVILEGDTLYIAGKKDLINSIKKRVHETGRYTDLHKVMIAGGGKTGLYLAKLLSEYGAAVKIIERDKSRCQYLSSRLENVLVLHGDATDLELLEEESFKEMDAFVSATGFDEENLLLALMAKQNGIEDVIAKISRESYSGLIEHMGIDMVMNPINISANHILRLIQGSNLIVFSRIIQGQAEFFEFIADEDMLIADKPIAQLNLPRGVIIAAIHRGSEVIIPSGNTEIVEGDRVTVLCLLSEAGNLEKMFRMRRGFFG